MICLDPDADELVWEKPRIMCEGFMRNKPIVTSSGRIIAPAYGYLDGKYALRCSDDGGESFSPSKISRVDGESLYAETWVASLPSGAKMITTWQTASTDAPDQYLYASDGENFDGPYPLPFKGQSTALTPLPDGRVMIVYNQRKESPVGVWLAVARPDESGLNLIDNIPIWQADTGTRGGTGADFGDWTNFSFGEPHVIRMKDGSYLLVFWCAIEGVNRIRYLHFTYEP